MFTVSRLMGIGTSLPSTDAQHLVLIIAPLCEQRQIVEYIFGVGMKDVRAVLVNQDPASS